MWRNAVLAGVFLWLVGGLFPLRAQLRIIPQVRLDSVRNPQTVSQRIRLVEWAGNRIEMDSIHEAAGPVHYTVRWHNGEARPLVITAVKSSCGCLQADAATEPVRAGGEGLLQVRYFPKGHPGAVDQRLFVFTNLSERRPTFVVRVVGYVTPVADRSGDYPHRFGALRLRQSEVHFRAGERQLRIACMNGGEEAVSPEIWQESPVQIRLWSEPRCLQPHQEGDLILELDNWPESVESPQYFSLGEEGRAIRLWFEPEP